jgi:hypothetical protein
LVLAVIAKTGLHLTNEFRLLLFLPWQQWLSIVQQANLNLTPVHAEQRTSQKKEIHAKGSRKNKFAF